MNVGTSPVARPGGLPQDIEWRLPSHPRSVGRARTLLRTQSSSWRLPEDAVETAVLLLSELMTNACRHGHASPGREISARCVLRGTTLRVEVSDAGSGLPRLLAAGPDDESGRGLALVAALAQAWDAGPRPCGIGKTVWFELAVPAVG
ncbi:ATP-binding protein [Streptomyces sp. NPDC006733]|uniref:ATP-binding protein n=1 Tax=Streptomyces sp. NPDC006733 TaxID=3155460 RepID=UPI0033E83CBD